VKRRRFLQTSALLFSAPALTPAARASAQANPGFHLGCVTYNLLKDFDLDSIIRMLQGAGFEGVELRTTHKHGVEPSIGPAERAKVRQKFERSKVRLVSYGTTCEFHSPDAEARRRQVEIAKQFVDLAVDTGALGIKVRPNGFPKEVPREVTIQNIAASLRELGDYAAKRKIGVWLEVHGSGTNNPSVIAAIMRATRHEGVGVCWNSNMEEVVNGSIREPFELLKPWLRHAHINELSNEYPWRELFTLMRQANYSGYTLAEIQGNPDPERLLRWYKALWTELNRPVCDA
jgi:sugar phosphate isomerase/epimerase